ncbi:MAG TPA: cytochrome P450 [Ktedonobacteraceae bacterium]|nr:cytochrome P450 [Ktedonobacteraceae bacterium]
MSTQQPSLGENYDPFGRDLENPYVLYSQLRHEEPITFSPVLNAYLVSRFEDVRVILSQPDLFSSKDTITPVVTLCPQALAELSRGYPLVPSFINGDGTEHTRFREPIQKAFAPGRIRVLESFLRQRISEVLDSFIDDGHAEIISQFAYPLPLEVILIMLGIPKEEMTQVKHWCDQWVALLFSPLTEDKQVHCARGVVSLHHYLIDIVRQRQRVPQADIITSLIETVLPGQQPLSDAELIATIMGLVAAGHETITRLIGNGLVLLLEEPKRWHRLCEHPEEIPLVIEEILRYHGPVRGFMRTTTRPTILGGLSLPTETKLFLLYSSANRDEERFSGADQFQMQRKPNHHLGFGHGVHFCVGAPLARLEGRLMFEALTQRLPDLRLAAQQQLAHNPDLVNYGYQRVEVVWNAAQS